MRGAPLAVSVLITAIAISVGCGGDPPPGRTYYERNIEPILLQKCAGNTSGCHSINTDDPFQFAAGNLDVTSFESLQKRRDVLVPFGAYPYPLLLIKSVPAGSLRLFYSDAALPIDVQHSGGPILDINSDAYFTLLNWLDNGATINGLKPATPARAGDGACSKTIPPGFVRSAFVNPMTQANYDAFRQTVQPILTQHGCNAGSCHGAPQSDFYITCGDTDDELAFNFSQAWSFVNASVEDSQLLRVPLAASAGGRGHTGGDQFANREDPDYVAVRTWATNIGVLNFARDPGRDFFARNIQPLLLQRGCSFEACHSPVANNDFKLRSGTQGFFSAVALEKNYELLKNEFMAFEFPDARRGRAVAKGLLSSANGFGITHRGGPVLETPGVPAAPASCTSPTASAYCAFQAWVDLERATAPLSGQVTPMATGATVQVVYVERPGGSATDRLDFNSFRGDAELKVGTSTLDAAQRLGPIDGGAADVISDACEGLSATGADIQAPDVANDGTRVTFAARSSATEPLRVYVANIDGSDCRIVTPAEADSRGIKVHNFDPAFSPDGNWIVFASTRGKPGTGASLSRKRFLPQADLWRIQISGTTPSPATVEQVTYLSNSEVGPQFMREGRIIMTTEKASDGFYQLSGRRINWDRTDYHPLLAQRATSPYVTAANLMETRPSVGFASATDIRESSDGNFLLVLSDVQASGAPVAPGGGGALAVFNRSVGTFEQGRTDTGYLPAMQLVNAGNATGRAGSPGSYRAPFALPSGDIMVSFAPNAAQANFDIVMVSPRGGANQPLFTAGAGGGRIRVDAVLAYRYPARKLYSNRRQLVFGGDAAGDAAHSVLHLPDAPLVFTLLTGNLRRGRPVDAFRDARYLAVFSEGLCPGSTCTATTNGIYENRQMLGSAELASDGSVRVRLPSQTGVVLELQDSRRNPLIRMGEEHQLGPGEQISMGVAAPLFNSVCAGCHGSITGFELDVSVTPDALTNASASDSATSSPTPVGP